MVHRATLRAAAASAASVVVLGACSGAGSGDETSQETTRPPVTVAGRDTGSTAAAPTTSGGSGPAALDGTILFSRWGGEYGSSSFFVVNADGTGERKLGDQDMCCPYVAGDGSRAVIVTTERIEVVNLDGSGSTILEPPGDTLNLWTGPFSPDGTQIAYAGWDPTDPTRDGIYIGSSDDPSDVVQIMAADHVPGAAAETPFAFANDFSPDGRQLVLYQPAPGDSNNQFGSLSVINLDGTGHRRLTPDGIKIPCCAHWSPDGSKILFSAIDGRMLTINPDGGGLTEVFSQAGSWVQKTDWSPDGSKIVFTLSPNANVQTQPDNGLYIVNSDGTGLTPIIVTPDFKTDAEWVPTFTGDD
jgi:WD40 repeat protein